MKHETHSTRTKKLLNVSNHRITQEITLFYENVEIFFPFQKYVSFIYYEYNLKLLQK